MQNKRYSCGPVGGRHRGFYNTVPVNITETETEYMLNLYAPALQKEAIAINTQNDILTIRYKGKKENMAYTHHEYHTEEINRSFDLKGKVAIDQIKAVYTEGVLRLALPKTDAAKRPLQEVPIE